MPRCVVPAKVQIISIFSPILTPHCRDAKVCGINATVMHDNDFAFRASNVCLVGENPACSVPACKDARTYDL